MDPEGASLLPLAIDGRIKQGAHFTWREGETAVTFLSPSVLGAFASTERPIAARGDWLQVVIPPSQAAELSTLTASFSTLSHSDSESDTEPETPPPPRSVTSQTLTLTVLSIPS